MGTSWVGALRKLANSLAFHNMPCNNTRKTKEVIHELKLEHPLLPRASKVCFQLVKHPFTRGIRNHIYGVHIESIGEERGPMPNSNNLKRNATMHLEGQNPKP